MNYTPEEIDAWLKRHNRNREWLAKQCGISPGAVGHWVNLKGKSRPVPAEHILTINRLMEEDEAREAEKPANSIVISFEDDEIYSRIEKVALQDKLTVREWALRELETAATADMEKVAADYLAGKSNILPMVAEVEVGKYTAKQEFRFVGACAAGEPVEALRNDTLAVESNLDPKKHVVVEVNGTSAEPIFKDGDRVLVEIFPGETRTARKGVPAIFRDSEGCYLKIYEGRDKPLRSVNPEANDLIPSDGMQLYGYPVGIVPED